MGTLTVGDVVIVIFPFADLSAFKRRPAMIVGHAEFGNLITCQITSKSFTSKNAIKISDADFTAGSLKLDSYVRPDKIFILEPSLIQSEIGKISNQKITEVKSAIQSLFK